MRECLEREKENDLSSRFAIFVHGEDFFSEGDVSEVATLIEVDDGSVRDCARLSSPRFAISITKTYPVRL